MKLVSWNVNGIRAAIKKGFEDFLTEVDPDILCLQEVKANREQVEWNIEGYEDHWNSAEKKGYSGVAVLTKNSPLSVSRGLGSEELDNEGRVLTLEFDKFYLLNVYTPNSKRDLARLDWRQNVWNPAFQEHLETLQKIKPVVFCGDLNVAHKEIDLANPKTNKKSAGFTQEEREGFDSLINEAGFIDSFRHFNEEPGHYTWWSYRPGIRERNIGWRIDYFCVSQALKNNMVNAAILKDVMGSDHCPISLDIKV